MRPITAVSIAALAAATLAACGLNGSTSTSRPGTASIGDTLTLTDPGFLNGNEDIAVTVVKVVLSPSSSEWGFGPGPGDQWVAVQVHLKNLAPVPYIDSPNDSLTAVDAAGQTIPADEDAPTTVGPQFSDQLHLTTGSAADGVITFDVPNGDKITTVLFTPGAGTAPTSGSGQWADGLHSGNTEATVRSGK